MYFGRPWEAPGSPKTLSKTIQKIIRIKDGKIGTRVHGTDARFFGWGRGVPSKIPAARDRETSPRATGTGKQAPGLQGQGNRPQGYRKPV